MQREGGVRGAAAGPAAGLKNDQQERSITASNACIANEVSTVYSRGVKVSRALHEVQGKAGGAGATSVQHLSRRAAAGRALIRPGQTLSGSVAARSAGGPGFRPGPAAAAAPTRIRVSTPHLPDCRSPPPRLTAPAARGLAAVGPTDWRSARARRLAESRPGRGPGPGRDGSGWPRGPSAG